MGVTIKITFSSELLLKKCSWQTFQVSFNANGFRLLDLLFDVTHLLLDECMNPKVMMRKMMAKAKRYIFKLDLMLEIKFVLTFNSTLYVFSLRKPD